MNSRYRRVYEMVLRVISFIKANAGAFSHIAVVQTYLAKLQSNAEALAQMGIDKVTHTEAAKNATLSRGDRRDLLHDQMQDIADLWKTMADEVNGDAQSFRMPANQNDQNMISTARSFLTEIPPLESQFTGRGLPEDFIERLSRAVDDFEESVNESEDKRRARAGTNAGFIEPSRICTRTVEKLNPIVKMVYRRNPQKLAEWLIASHIERAAQTKKDKGDPPKD